MSTQVIAQVIDIRAVSGGAEYTWPLTVTESTGKNISTDMLQVSLGTYSAPGEWRAPDSDEPQDPPSQRVVQMLIGGTLKPATGAYYLWTRVTDSPEIVPRRHQRVTVLADP